MVGFTVSRLFWCNKDGISKLAVGKSKRFFYFFQSHNMEDLPRGCWKFTSRRDWTNSWKRNPMCITKKKESNLLSHKLLHFGRATWGSVSMCLTQSALLALCQMMLLLLLIQKRSIYSSTPPQPNASPWHRDEVSPPEDQHPGFPFSWYVLCLLKLLCQRWAPISPIFNYAGLLQNSNCWSLEWCHMPQQALLSMCGWNFEETPKQTQNIRHQRVSN